MFFMKNDIAYLGVNKVKCQKIHISLNMKRQF